MAQTIEDVNSRTLLQQFHSLYKKQDAIETNVENVDAKVEQEKSDRQTADLSINSEIQALKDQIDSLGVLFTYKGEVATIQDLPAENNKLGDVWYVDSEQAEYIWIEKNGVAQWEEFGPAIDLNEYAKQEDLKQLEDEVDAMNTQVESNASNIVSLTNTKQDKLTAGTNITIDANNVISASGGDKLYGHNIKWNNKCYFQIINKSNSPMTALEINNYLSLNGSITVNNLEKETFSVANDRLKFYNYIYAGSPYPKIQYTLVGGSYDGTEIIFNTSNGNTGTSSSEFVDTVTEL